MLDLTAFLTAVMAAILGLIGAIATALINARMKDQQAAKIIDAAIGNAIGAGQLYATDAIVSLHAGMAVPALTPAMMVMVQYALDHAGPELARYGITPAAVADKITARLGLRAIELKAAGVDPLKVLAPLAAPAVAGSSR